jgi:hypothetical protein
MEYNHTTKEFIQKTIEDTHTIQYTHTKIEYTHTVIEYTHTIKYSHKQ